MVVSLATLSDQNPLSPADTKQLVRVLMVEDSKNDVFLIQHMLQESAENCHYAFTDVPRLVDAFRRVDKQEFDVVLLDLGLLDIDGLAYVSALHAEIPHTPIIVYSGHDDPKLMERALSCGASSYLVKGRDSAFTIQKTIQKVLTAA